MNVNTDADAADTGSAFGEDDSEFNLFNTNRQLAALQTAVKMLGSSNEKKVLIYFASGLQLNGIDNQAQFQATTNAAIRANIIFFTIDARGLVALAPMGNATQGRRAARPCSTAAAPWPRPLASRRRRTPCTPWPPIPAAKRCSITTTWRWVWSRPRRRFPTIT